MNFKTLLFLLLVIIVSSCKKDPCESISCMNDGYCANGTCVCPDGYTGADCSQQETPSQIKISKIEVTRFPATDNGAGWDLTSGPDIFVEITQGNATVWTASTYYENADPTYAYSFDVNPIASISSPNDQYTISLYDYDDFDTDDFMGGINFTPYTSNNGFPSIISIDAGGGVAFNIYVSYSW